MNADLLSGLFWLVIGLGGIYGSYMLDLGTMREPGSGFTAFIASSFVSLLALIVFLQSLQKRRQNQKLPSLWRGLNWEKSLGIFIILIFYVLSFERLGFIISSFLIILILLKFIWSLSWGKALLLSVLISGISYISFKICLGLQLPGGFLG